MPLFKSQMNDLNWSALYETPSAFGMIWRENKSATFPFLLSAKENGNIQGNDLEDASMGQEWHRFVAEIDLDAKRTSCFVYRLGLDHPTPATTGTLAASKSGLYFYSPLTAARGAVSGIGIYTSMTSASTDDAANSACFDNLLVEWKAPGTSEFLSCYENDLATRRVRTICPAGTTSVTYAATTIHANDEFTGYEARQLVPDSDTSLKNVRPQPTGVDNWRRINDDGQGKAEIVDSPTRCLRMMKDLNAFVCVSQPLGEEIASGKVRLSANVRLPDKWRNLSTRCSLIVLGAKSYASTLHQNLSQGHVGQVGIGGTADTDFRPRYAEGGAQYGSATCTASSWYQLVQTADIDNQTYDYTLYAIVNGTIQTNPVFSVTGKPFANTVDSIGSFALMGYTHQGIGNRKDAGTRRYPDPEKGWDQEFIRHQLAPVRDFELRHNAKIYVGEFSAISWAPGADQYIRDCIEIFEEYGWDWCYHAFREWEGWSVEKEWKGFGNGHDVFVPSADNPRKRALLDGFRR